MSRAHLAKAVIVSESLVAAWESGRAVPRPEHVASLIEILPFGPDIVQRILGDLVSGEVSPEWTGKWLTIEDRADTLLSFEHSIVPGLLQTEDYARTVLRHNQHSPIDVEEQVRQRLDRQRILDRDDPPMAVFVLDEQVLRRAVGERKTMMDQLTRLLDVAQRPNVIIQVVPLDVGYHPGLAGAFTLAKFDGMEVAYHDGALKGQVIEDRDQVSALSRVWETIRASALSRAASIELVEKAAERWAA